MDFDGIGQQGMDFFTEGSIIMAVETLILTAPIHCKESIDEQVIWC